MIKYITFVVILTSVLFSAKANIVNELADNADINGFYEMRAGWRLQNDKNQKDMSIMENRLQLEIFSYLNWADFKIKGDTIGDLVTEEGDFDLREAWFFSRPADFMDIKIGRQVLTWGTGDFVFINDLFPKDWNSFFIGRDDEYLKAPSDAAKISLFLDIFNIDFVYTPKFDNDRFIDGRRISYYNSMLDQIAGDNAVIHTDRPNDWFKDDEFAVRIYKNMNNYEYALYGYQGYWKSPGGFNNTRTQAIFPDLRVYGASVRGEVAKGIGNIEVGYYDSLDDTSGKDPLINNSEFRFLAGYSQDIAKDFNMGVQYYLERIMDYGDYKRSAAPGLNRDKNRHLLTLRLTKLMYNQNLRLSLFTFFSPSDKDAYFRPNINYKIDDRTTIEVGANIFVGDSIDTFFGEFEDNSNFYTAFRYSF